MRQLAVALLVLVACTQPRSTRCKEICKREAECVDQTGSKITFDQNECIAACSVLENDVDNAAKVTRHADCVNRQQQNCSALLECP